METIALRRLGIGYGMRCNQCLPDHKATIGPFIRTLRAPPDFPFFAPNPPIKHAKTRARACVLSIHASPGGTAAERRVAPRSGSAASAARPARHRLHRDRRRVTRTGGFMVHNILYSAPSDPAPRRRDADTFRRAVVDGDEACHLAMIPGEGGGHVGSHITGRSLDHRSEHSAHIWLQVPRPRVR